MKQILAYPPTDFSVPFSTLRPEAIDIYFHYDNRIGGATCKALCEHCYFRNRPTFHIPFEHAVAITDSLRTKGYNIGMASADSFGDEALMSNHAGSAHRLKSIGATAWSSGVPLYQPGWQDRLDKAWELGFRSLVVTAHSAAGTTVPLRGVTKPKVIEGALRNAREWNSREPGKAFTLCATMTIGRHNNSLDDLRRMADWGIANGLDVLRFNCFANFQNNDRHIGLEMTKEGIADFFRFLAIIHAERIGEKMTFGLSEDWGDSGIEQIYPYLPEVWQSRTTSWCRAGYRLFAMIKVESEVVLVGCVDKWDPILGRLVKCDDNNFAIEWDVEQIELLRTTVMTGKVYACWGGVGFSHGRDRGFGVDTEAEKRMFKVH